MTREDFMNDVVEKLLAMLDDFETSGEMTYLAYNDLYDEISLLGELLEEQKPRVLTLEEARRAEYCVMELRDGKELMQFVHDDRGGYFSPSLNGREHPYFEDIAVDDEYNVHVRCWSAIPTDEQRKEVKWGG